MSTKKRTTKKPATKTSAPKPRLGEGVVPPPGPAEDIGTLLDIERLDTNRFRGLSPASSWGRVYGGQVLAQGLVAATRTVPAERVLHSLHGYFLLAGSPKVPIDYEVELLRDGGSFTTRRVLAMQEGRAIFAMTASFHVSEPGFAHQSRMPDVPPPEEVPPLGEVLARSDAMAPDTMRAYYARESRFDVRVVEYDRYQGAYYSTPRQHIWMKAKQPLPERPAVHAAVLVYASDMAMIDTALIAHGKVMFDPGMQLASLDHALWLHRPVRADQWLLYALESPFAGGGRGLTRGAFYSREGALIATVSQEGLMRARSTAFVIK